MSLEERVNYLKLKEKHKRKLKPWYKKWWGLILIAVFVLIISGLIASGIYLVKEVKRIQAGNLDIETQKELDRITQAIDGTSEHFSLGPINAPIKITAFLDYSCPHCNEAMATIHNLNKKYPTEVRISIRDYPALRMASINQALAAHCAGEQNNFWQMSDSLFENQDILINLNENNIDLELKNIAKGLKLDEAQFEDCLKNKKYLYRLNDDFADAEFLDVKGTPTWFINRYKITGYYPEENFVNLIEGLLAL
ncbi:MAG: hypothetical protein EOM88_02710 [Clostridia bacterium]|nr:hypothetical protein [Clostridia bacterium]